MPMHVTNGKYYNTEFFRRCWFHNVGCLSNRVECQSCLKCVALSIPKAVKEGYVSVVNGALVIVLLVKFLFAITRMTTRAEHSKRFSPYTGADVAACYFSTNYQ